MIRRLVRSVLLGVLLTCLAPGAAQTQEGKSVAVLQTQSLWRCAFAWGPEMARWESGEATPYREAKPGTEPAKRGMEKVQQDVVVQGPPAHWLKPEFDDAGWVAGPGPFQHLARRHDLALICTRGRFEVTDPSKVSGLTLNLVYRGGVAVFVNGQEVGRGHLPKGDLRASTLAEDYAKEAYVDPDGKLLGTKSPQKDRLDSRNRQLRLEIEGALLKPGTNVLAIEVHRAATSELFWKSPMPEVKNGPAGDWAKVGLDEVSLTAAPGSPIEPSKLGRLVVRPGNPLVEVFDTEPSDAAVGKLAPVVIPAARNGAFDGVVLVQAPQAIKGLKLAMSDLSQGTSKIPATAVQLRYGKPGHPATPHAAARQPAKAQFLGVLAETLPEEVSVPPQTGTATLPVWLTVRVPREAAPGTYEGSLTVSLGGDTLQVPVRVVVADFILPDPNNFVSFVGLVESPESVALQYNVPLWSDAHFKLLDKAFTFLNQVGNDNVFIPLIAQTNYGNEESMVRWIRQDNGSYQHDFTIVERYLDLVVKHHKAKPTVCFYVWTPAHGGGSFGATPDKPGNAHPMQFTLLDPKTGKVSTEKGPDWGTAESKPFWKPVFEGLNTRLADRKLDGCLALGVVEDFTPSKQCVDDLEAVAPKAPWVVHSHGHTVQFAGRPVAEIAFVWGHPRIVPSSDPQKKYGWKNPVPRTVYPRYGATVLGALDERCPLGLFHVQTEGMQAAGLDGVNRLALDFWAVVKDQRGMKRSVISRYAQRDRPGPPMLSGGEPLLAAEPTGPVATVRYEALRLGTQEAEARIYIEKALLDNAKRAKVGDALAKRCLEVLDDRVAAILRASVDNGVSCMASSVSWLSYAGTVPERSAKLYQVAAEVQQALGDHK